ncbi:isocitrate/isopropylmalate family dehydrogenase [Methanobrevibacter curvatus]|uniref:Homoisocitrate dehydrogenase n=1 Tax=Methanobrevibacter curvatus TaxID=49547 RepID=A0A166BJA1_9EURY|nr:isocitrate/isopropylmalate family dehydrogenase [Methanobrevibacter curvatus]KZX13431.1 homoisocitrate dehydrogenase [Methanobrevibacter curvatus]
MYKIAVIPGDGIGKEVMEGAIDVLEGTGVEFSFTYENAGDECLKDCGYALPDDTLALAKKSDAVLFGAAGETAADVIVRLRQELDLYANLRPVKSYPGTNAIFQDIDFMIVRENTEGMYIGVESENKDGATAKRLITHKASQKICDYAFKYAITTGRKRVTGVHKANVLKITDGLFKKTFYEVAEKYDTIESNDYYVDATAMYLLTKPQFFDVIVTTNLYGDILSDEGAGIVGGLGLIPSANIGDKGALFEPVHGSAPDIAGQSKANPIAMILSAKMMLEFLGENESAKAIDEAVLKVITQKNILTPDMGGNSTTKDLAKSIKNNL